MFEELKKHALEIRKKIIVTAHTSRTAHVGSSLSCVDILTYLYFNKMHIGFDDWDNRDIFILSKAHAALSLYATLTEKKIFTESQLAGYFLNNGTLPGHLDKFSADGIEASAGSLGHGFNIALGMAHGFKLKKDNRKVFTLIGDGESQEGSIWEGAEFASHLKIDNFTAFLDYNNLQGYGRPREICHFEPIEDKWKAFGWDVKKVSGHDFNEIDEALNSYNNGKPKIIIAETVKGKGVPFMENELKWHYYIVNDDRKERALKELY